MGRIITIPYRRREVQKKLHQEIERHRFSVLVLHRRAGKTVLAVNHLIKAALTCQRKDPRTAYLAPLHSQAKSVAWDYLKHFTASVPGRKINESELWVGFPNGGRVRLFGADNPDALRGLYFDAVVLDEVAQMKPEVWAEVVRPALSDRDGSAVFIGTPKGQNLFFELYQQALTDPEWYAALHTVDDTRILTDEELDSARRTMSQDQYRQEFLCDWSASSEDVLIPIDLVNEARMRDYPHGFSIGAPVVMGVDVARFGDDSSVLIRRKGLQAYDIVRFQGIDLMRLAGEIVARITAQPVHALFIDAVGIGAGVVDRIRQLGHSVIAVQSGESSTDSTYANLRAEMWGKMRDWLKDGGQIPDDFVLRNDLSSLTYSFDNRNRIVLERKSDAKKRGIKSPDCADALALTFAAPVGHLALGSGATGFLRVESSWNELGGLR